MRNTTYRVNVTQEGNSLTVDSVEKWRKFNQHSPSQIKMRQRSSFQRNESVSRIPPQ